MALLSVSALLSAQEFTSVYLLNAPAYSWHAGCYGTACGNLAGFWDRNGFPDIYTGPTGGGLAPVYDSGANVGIRSMWASRAGLDGRPVDQPGHIDDYWARYDSDSPVFNSYESTAEDTYVLSNRVEHPPDCIGDFIGLSQKKWTNMNDECDGNIDAYSFVYWDKAGGRRVNFEPPPDAGLPAVDIQSGLRAWTRWRGYEADVFTQLTDVNTNTPPGAGYTFEDVKAEIHRGYPVMVFLQPYHSNFRSLPNMPRANPDIHAMLIYGYQEDDLGTRLVRVRNSWNASDFALYGWSAVPWTSNLQLRGVIGFRPKPKIKTVHRQSGDVTLTWDGPAAQLHDENNVITTDLHQYVVERSDTLDPAGFQAVSSASTNRTATVAGCAGSACFLRVRLIEP